MEVLEILLASLLDGEGWDGRLEIPEGEAPICLKRPKEKVWTIGDDGDNIIERVQRGENFSVPMWNPRCLERMLAAVAALRIVAQRDPRIDGTEVVLVRCNGRDGVIGMFVREAM